MKIPTYAFTICIAKEGAIYDKNKEVLTFLSLANALPEHFRDFLFRSKKAAIRALALYWVIRARNEHKYDLNSDIVKKAYNEIINGNRICQELDGTIYFIRQVLPDDPIHEGGVYITLDELENFIPTLDSYLNIVNKPHFNH